MQSSGNTGWKVDAAGVGACLAMTALLFFAGVRPLLAQQEQRLATEAAVRQHRQEAAVAGAAVGDLKRRLAETEARIEELPLRLQAASRLNARVAELAALAASQGLEVSGVQPGPPRAGPRYQMLPLQLLGTGNYRSCTAFLRQLHGECPDMGVWSLRLRLAAGQDNRPQFEFALVWYALPASAVGP